MMSIALKPNTNTSNPIQRSPFIHRNIYGSVEKMGESSSSSSIGKNSDVTGGSSDGGVDDDDGEVESEYKGGFSNFDDLEEALPIKRGISTFYRGKSKSFTSLADVVTSCTSMKDIAKPEDAYTKKRKNLLAHTTFWDKNKTHLKCTINGISKRNAVNMNSSEKDIKNNESPSSNTSSPRMSRPPLPPNRRRSPEIESSLSPPQRSFSSWRSFSLSDLQHAAAVNNGDKGND